MSQFKCFLKNKKEIFKKKNKKNIPPPFALFVSEALSRGLDLPRLKRAKFVNSVLKVEQVSLDTFAEMFNRRLFFLTTVIVHCRDSYPSSQTLRSGRQTEVSTNPNTHMSFSNTESPRL